MNMPYVTIYTDGSWRHKQNKGGWAALIVCGPFWQIIADGESNTTIPRMELKSVIMALSTLTMSCNVTIISDSTLIVNIINNWLGKWESNGFKTVKKEPVANQDLLIELSSLKQKHIVSAIWVRAHTKSKDINSLGNAVVDEFAQILTR